MRTVRPISEAEMVALFLATEYPAPRTHQKMLTVLLREGLSPRIIEQPDLRDAQENNCRRTILEAYRGNYFQDFPFPVQWERAMLSKQELEQVRYIEYDYWGELSKGSRLPRDGARTILAGNEVFGVSNQGFLQMAEALRSGVQFPTLILVGKTRQSTLVVCEGHARLTAMFLVPECLPAELEVVVGLSEQMDTWRCY